MRICIISPGGFHRSGRKWVIPALLRLTQTLAKDHQVTVVVYKQEAQPSQYRLGDVQVVNLGDVSGGLPGQISRRQLNRLLTVLKAADDRPDVLHAFWVDRSGVLAALAGWRLGIPVVCSLGGGELVWRARIGYGSRGDWKRRVQARVALRLCQAATAGSDYALEPLRTLVPSALWLPLGIEADLFETSPARPPGPPWRVIHVASINRVKNQIMLLRSIASASRRLPGIELDLVGADFLDGSLSREAKRLGLEGQIHFHGLLANEEIVPLYQRAHLYLQSSWHESQGVSLCEAAAAGVPTVGTPVGLLPELAPQAARLVAFDDAGAMAESIVCLLSNSGKREQLGSAAQHWARQHDVRWTAAQFEKIYHAIRGKKPRWFGGQKERAELFQ